MAAGGCSIQSKFATAIRLQLRYEARHLKPGLATARPTQNHILAHSRSGFHQAGPYRAATAKLINDPASRPGRPLRLRSGGSGFEEPQPTNTQAIPRSLRSRRNLLRHRRYFLHKPVRNPLPRTYRLKKSCTTRGICFGTVDAYPSTAEPLG